MMECREARIDIAEGILHERLEKSDTALIFFLKTQGRKRGYSEKEENGETQEIKVILPKNDN